MSKIKHVQLIYMTLVSSCSNNPYLDNNYANVTNYYVNATVSTPSGISVDLSDQLVDLEKIDELTLHVESCLKTTIHRQFFVVKIPSNWYNGCRNKYWQLCYDPGCGEQLFPCFVDPRLCEEKGFFEQCECGCRAIIQDNNVIVTAPNLHMYTAELIRMVTGVNNIWTDPVGLCYKEQ